MTDREEEQAALNALHALDPHERQIFRAEMRTDPHLRELAAEFEDAAAQIALLLPGEAPPEEIRPMILKTLKQRRREKETPIRAFFRFLLGPRIAWAAAACLAVIAWSARGTIRHLTEQIAALSQGESEARGDAAAVKDKVAGLEHNLSDARNAADQLAGEIASLKQTSALARMEVIVLRAMLRRFEESVAVIVWDSEKREGRLRLEKMLPVPANKDYQLWIIDKKSSTPVGTDVVKVDGRGNASKPFKFGEPVPGAVKFAISMETLGGAARKPTDGFVVFAGP